MLCCVCALYKGVPLSNFLHKFQNLRSEGQMEKTDCFQTVHYCVRGKNRQRRLCDPIHDC